MRAPILSDDIKSTFDLPVCKWFATADREQKVLVCLRYPFCDFLLGLL